MMCKLGYLLFICFAIKRGFLTEKHGLVLVFAVFGTARALQLWMLPAAMAPKT